VSDLRTHIGTTLRRRRERHGLTQAELAERTATSQATVARVEAGERAPSVAMLERLFGALGCQVRLRLEPLDHETDHAIATLAGVRIETRIAESGIPALADLAPIPYVFRGAAAALLQGAPVPVDAIEIALARPDCDAFVRWLGRRYGKRWNPQYQDFGIVPVDPRLPGENLWRIIGGVRIRVELADSLPESIEVHYDGRGYRVVPLPDVEVHDPDAARLLRRVRAASMA
jgi:transcriptional regulator with XRE-family HTH domain